MSEIKILRPLTEKKHRETFLISNRALLHLPRSIRLPGAAKAKPPMNRRKQIARIFHSPRPVLAPPVARPGSFRPNQCPSSRSACLVCRSLLATRHGLPFCPWYQYSNRNCYEKLELVVTSPKSVTSFFLIATKMHLLQIKNAPL